MNCFINILKMSMINMISIYMYVYIRFAIVRFRFENDESIYICMYVYAYIRTTAVINFLSISLLFWSISYALDQIDVYLFRFAFKRISLSNDTTWKFENFLFVRESGEYSQKEESPPNQFCISWTLLKIRSNKFTLKWMLTTRKIVSKYVHY